MRKGLYPEFPNPETPNPETPNPETLNPEPPDQENETEIENRDRNFAENSFYHDDNDNDINYSLN